MIRRADADDIERLVPLVRAFLAEEAIEVAEPDWRRNLAAMVDDARACVLIAERDGITAGFATATTTAGIEFGRSAEIEDLYFLPRERGTGLGTALFEAGLDWARDQGARMAIVVLTDAGQRDASLAAFYERYGFEAADRLIRYRAL